MGRLRQIHSGYTGRFAPSPTGPLHFGSLLAALASYLDARSHGGQWLLRIEDLDPVREPPGTADHILRTLDAFGLHHDGPVLYQSQRLPAYQQVLDELLRADQIYACSCSRQQIREMGGVHAGRCHSTRLRRGEAVALRLDVPDACLAFHDLIQGDCEQQLAREVGDFVVLRKDGLFAYQLAVVVDDGFQGVTHVVRGVDLLDSTARQIHLQQLLGLPRPVYAHIPVAVNELGQKLSKQHFAEAVRAADASLHLFRALSLLGQSPAQELRGAAVGELLAWAVDHWDIQAVPKLANIPV